MAQTINIGILGASGYGGGELLRWLTIHPNVRIATAVSKTYAGKPVSGAFPGLAKRCDLVFSAELDPQAMSDCEVIFLAQENGAAMKSVPALVEAGCRIIDLSADFRFREASDYATWYGVSHASPALCKSAVYGLPELHREAIRSATIVGNPGCYTTTSILALAPLVQAGLVDVDTIVIDGKSGMSGAGRSKFGLETHFSEVNETVTAYKIAGTHRHTGEIEQELGLLHGSPISVSFTPHTVPMTRGILVTALAKLKSMANVESLRELYREFYAGAPFVFVSEGLPSSKHVTGSNMCHIGLAVDARTERVTVISVTDNLGKGMVGQAIQNMNLMMGCEETAGLNMPGQWP